VKKFMQKAIKTIIAFFTGTIGFFLLFPDLIDYLSKGFHTGVWDWAIMQAGYLSMFVGFSLLLVTCYLGVNIFKS
jgi:hypothetical protein